jgi:hypothetical protein
MNLRNVPLGANYAFKASTRDNNIVNPVSTIGAPNVATGYALSYELDRDDSLNFVGGATSGTATLTYELIDKSTSF